MPEKQEEELAFRGHSVTLAEVKELIEREQREREDLAYEQKLALDHTTHFVRIPVEKARALVDGLKALGGRVTEWHAYKLADILPTHPDDVRAVFARDRTQPEKEEIERILETVRGYL